MSSRRSTLADRWVNGPKEAFERLSSHLEEAPPRFDARDRIALAFVLTELLADRAAVRALVEALPDCGSNEWDEQGPINCHKPATRAWRGTPDTGGGQEPLEYFCDDHASSPEDDLDYAPALRALLERIKGWDG